MDHIGAGEAELHRRARPARRTQCGTKSYCPAMSRTVTDPSGSAAVPRLLSTNSPCRWKVSRVDDLDIAGRVQRADDAGRDDDRHHHDEHRRHDHEPAFLGAGDDLAGTMPSGSGRLQRI